MTVVIFAMAILMILQYPFIQTQLAHEATIWLSDVIGYPTHIEKVRVDWFDVIRLSGVQIKDSSDRTMVDVNEIVVDYRITNILQKGDIFLDKVILRNGTVDLIKDPKLNMTGFIKAISDLAKRKKTGKTKKRKPILHIAHGSVEKMNFSYNNPNAERFEEGRFDYNHFGFREIYGDVSNFRVSRDTVELKASEVKGFETHTNLEVKELHSDFRFTKRNMSFQKLYAIIGNSILRDSLVMVYDTTADFSHFNTRVEILANLKKSKITAEDLSYFAPSMKILEETYQISGRFRGKVKNFKIYDLNFHFGKGSNLRGKMGFRGLPDFFETLMSFSLNESIVYPEDLKQYLPELHYGVLQKFGKIDFNGRFDGFANDFVTDGKFNTQLGFLSTDINLQISSNSYEGQLFTKDFNIGRLVGRENEIQKVDMQGSIKGKGLGVSTAKFDLNGRIHRLGLLGYDYKDIHTNGHFEKELFKGKLSVNDKNLKMLVDGQINFKDENFNFWAEVDTALLHNLYLTKDSLFVKTIVDAKFEGLQWDKIRGRLEVFDTKINHFNNTLDFDELKIQTDKDSISKNRTIDINSDWFDLAANGNFNMVKLYEDAFKYLEEFADHVNLDKVSNDIRQIVKNKESSESAEIKDYSIAVEVKLTDIAEVINLFTDSIFVAKNSWFKGDLKFGKESEMIYWAKSDSVFYKNYQFFDDSLVLFSGRYATEVADSSDFQFEGFLSSKEQNLNNLETENFTLYTHKLGNRILFENSIKHRNSNDKMNLNGDIGFYSDRFEVSLVNTNFLVLDKPWKTNGVNRFIVNGKEIGIKNLSFSSGEQLINVAGNISEDSSQILNIELQNFDVGIISTYTGKQLEGKANVDAFISDIYAGAKVGSEVIIDSLKINELLYGNIRAYTQWDDYRNKLNIDASINRDNLYSIDLEGDYIPFGKNKDQLNLNASFEKAPLYIIEPFMSQVISELKGEANGDLTIDGSLASPMFQGKVAVKNGSFKVNYLNTTYRFGNEFQFHQDTIKFEDFVVKDEADQEGIISGLIYRDNSDRLMFDISGNVQNYKVINIPETPEAIYYGTGYGSGNFKIYGYPSEIEISIQAKTEKKTKIFIPLEGSEDVKDQSYITYVSDLVKEDKVIDFKQEVNMNGILFNLDLEITPDAYCEIIFDKKAGDIMRGNGRGKLKMEIDTKGEFNMFGDVEIVKGAYNFTLLNVVDKKFNVMPKSKIIWTGDPYGASLDVNASYTQFASLLPIIEADSSALNSPELRKRYPIHVLLNLKGKLLNPIISFDIDIDKYPHMVATNSGPVSIESYVASFEQKVKNNEQELNRQVFSLIVLRQLSAENRFTGIENVAGSSVSELLGNQLSYWVSQVDENLEIDFDLNGLDAEAWNAFQLRLSYNFLDGRLRVTRDGGFTNQRNETNLTSVFGDISVEYLLTPDGRLRAKMYHKSNENSFNTGLENNSKAGMSVMHTASFDSLFGKKNKKKKGKKKDGQQNKQAGEFLEPEEAKNTQD
ncbi:MAG: translocation/assembly module TamB [Flammeovirgaceae bacterium]|nr:translocation/assembly module TamB [Flammeovirgaceae bacterium]